MRAKKFKLKTIKKVIILLVLLLLTACQNANNVENVGNADNAGLKDEISAIDKSELYNDELVTTKVLNLNEKYNSLYDQIQDMKAVSEYEVGKTIEDFDTIFLGKKEQDGIFENGEENIEWILLYKDDEKALFQTKYIIDEIQYINIDEQYNLPEYLNKKYINEIFDKEEINLLKNVKVKKKVYEKESDDPYERIKDYDLKNFQEDRKLNLISYEDMVSYYGDVSIEDYHDDGKQDVTNSKIYNNKIVTAETDYVKKVIYNGEENLVYYYDEYEWPEFYYKFQEEENYKDKNIRVDEHHWYESNYYFLDSDLVDDTTMIPEVFVGAYAASNKGIVKKNFDVFSDYCAPNHDDSKYYSAGLRPTIYIDLNKAKNYKLKGEYKKYKYFELKKGEVFKLEDINKVHKVSDYPDSTYLENIESVEIGSFKTYDGSSESVPIEWIVLDKLNDSYLLVSKYPIALKRFDEEGRNVDYFDSSIRKWLNEEFYDSAFTDDIKYKIKMIKYNNDNEDKVFLLGADDIHKYFSKQVEKESINVDQKYNNSLDEKKLLSNTTTFDYVEASVHREPFYGKWNDFNQGFILRDNGTYSYLVQYIDNEGKINEEGTLTDMPYMPIRPAIYVSDKNVDIEVDYESKFKNSLSNNNDEKSIDGINNIFIGKCEQDGEISNGKEDIEWEVIGKEGENVILISKYILDAEKISKSYKICKYENSVLRKKLQNLCDEYFNGKEKDLLIERDNVNYNSVLDGVNGSDITREKLFVLSIDDIRKFLGDTNKPYDILKSENTYYLNTRPDIQRFPNDLYLDNNYFLRSVGAIPCFIAGSPFALVEPRLYEWYADYFYWSNVDKNGLTCFKVADECYDFWSDYDELINYDLYYNGIRPCIKVNISKLKAYLNEDRDINVYVHKRLDKGVYSLCEIEKVKTLKQNEDYITFDNIDTIKFGKYNINDDDSSDLEWFVLYKDSEKALLLSKYLIDKGSFGDHEIWEFSNIRKKLNEVFYKNSFTDSEKEKILTTPSTPRIETLKATFDKIHIIDEKLINEYILDGDVNDEKYLQKLNRLKVSKYLKDFVVAYNPSGDRYGEFIQSNYIDYAPYCLNNNNKNKKYNTYIDPNGQMSGTSNGPHSGIRPVIWVKLNDNVVDKYAPKPKPKKYNENDTIEEKIRKSDAISKYSEEQNIDDFDTVEFGKFFQGEDGKGNFNGYIHYQTMDTMEQYNNRYIENKKEEKRFDHDFKYDKSLDKNIEWIILDKNDEYAILMSKYILYSIREIGDAYKVNRHYRDREFAYAEGRTRKWLNDVFYNIAFSEDEKKKISPMGFEDCSQKGTNEIKTFYDNVSILNSVELAKYFGYISENEVNKKIATQVTAYALGLSGLKNAKDYEEYGYGNSAFLVRSNSINTSKVIRSNGKLDEDYPYTTGIRPVIKISLNGSSAN